VGETSYIQPSSSVTYKSNERQCDRNIRYVLPGILEERYGHGLEEQSPEEFLERVAGERCGGDLIRAETMVLRDFRDGRLGLVGLEAPEGSTPETRAAGAVAHRAATAQAKLAAASAAADAVAVLAVAAPVGVADVPA